MKATKAESIWAVLVGLTLGSAWLAESGSRSVALTLTVAVMIALKGRLVIDHYMEMTTANRKIRRVLYLFITVVPAMVLLTYAFGPQIARLTAL